MSGESPTAFDPRIVLRPRSVDETFDLAVAYLRTEIRGLALLFSLVSVGTTLLLFAPVWWWGMDEAWAWLGALVLVSLLERVITVYVGRHLFRAKISVLEAVGAVLRRFVPLVLQVCLSLLPMAMILVGAFQEGEGLIGFGVLLAMLWPFLVAARLHLSEAMLLEQIPVRRALRRSGALTAHRYGRSLGVLSLGLMLRFLFAFAMMSGANFVVGFVLQFQGASDHIGPVGAMLGYAASGPYLALARLFDYVDARTRREGWDIQVRFNAIAERIERAEKDRAA